VVQVEFAASRHAAACYVGPFEWPPRTGVNHRSSFGLIDNANTIINIDRCRTTYYYNTHVKRVAFPPTVVFRHEDYKVLLRTVEQT